MFANSNKNIVLCHDYLKCKVTDAHYLVHALEIHTKNELKGSTYRTVAPTINLIMFYVHVIKSLSTSRFYIGSTGDTDNRLTEHNSGEVKATRSYRLWVIAHTESFSTRSKAYRRERQIKSWKNPDYMRKRLGISL